MPLRLPARGTHLISHASLLLPHRTPAPNPLPSVDPIHYGASSCCPAISVSPRYRLVSAVARVTVHTCEEARVHGGPSALAYSAASGNPSSSAMLGRELREPLPSPCAVVSQHPRHCCNPSAPPPPPLAVAPVFHRAILVCNHAVHSLVRNRAMCWGIWPYCRILKNKW